MLAGTAFILIAENRSLNSIHQHGDGDVLSLLDWLCPVWGEQAAAGWWRQVPNIISEYQWSIISNKCTVSVSRPSPAQPSIAANQGTFKMFLGLVVSPHSQSLVSTQLGAGTAALALSTQGVVQQ